MLIEQLTKYKQPVPHFSSCIMLYYMILNDNILNKIRLNYILF